MTTMNSAQRESQLGRIRALMAKTIENGCTEAEAAAAAAMVDALMAKYEIDLDEVAMRKQEIIQASVNGGEHPVVMAANAIATFTDCRVWLIGGKLIKYLGFAIDTEIAEYLTLLFKRAIDREAAAFTLFNHEYDALSKPERREMVRSFGIGMAARLGERLRDLKSKRDFTARSAGRDLVVMKAPQVNEAFDALGLTMGRTHRINIRNKEAAKAGHAAGDHVAINQGIADRAARQGGMVR
jgi:hypothetical protein